MRTDLAIAICTRNRADRLRQALCAIGCIDTPRPWELIVVDNGSSDDTQAVLARFAHDFPRPLKVVYEREPGLGRARNRAWQTSSSDVIAFTDDDCYPSPDFAQKVLECFEDSRLHFLGGRILLFDPTDFPITVQLKEERLEIPPRSFIPAGLIQGANFAVRRDVLEAVGGFDPHLGAGTPFPFEDVDVLSRASAAGYVGAYDPRPVVFHHHRRKRGREVDKLIESYDIGRGAYYFSAILDARRRYTYARRWIRLSYRRVRLDGDVRTVLNELRGAAAYASHRLCERLWGG